MLISPWQEWEFCVPTAQLDDAVALIRKQSDEYTEIQPLRLTLWAINSLRHNHPRFKCDGTKVTCTISSSQYYHIDCDRPNIEKSPHTALPYPTLPVFAQSLLDTENMVDLEDLIDGMNLDLEWGKKNLDLSGYTDTAWKRWKVDALLEDGEDPLLIYMSRTERSRQALWERCVNKREDRLGWKYPKEIWATRFRRHGSEDPRTRKRGDL